MGHEGHHEAKQPLRWFASPLHEHTPAEAAYHSANLEQAQKGQHHGAVATNPNDSEPEFENMDYPDHDSPKFHRHAEATTAELFFDLFFVANLTTFTSLLEINDRHSLTSYAGFFSLLWLTWYQVSLYDVRFSTDCVFERCCKAVHFGVMVAFAVIGPQWHPGQEIPTSDYKIYKAFGLVLMISRLTLFCQYGVTLMYTKKYKKTILPIAMVMAWTLLAAILYGALTPIFPGHLVGEDGSEVLRKSNLYIAWYIIAISETILTVVVSCVWRIISFKGTHMVQRMSLLTLIILGEGIIVICKSISKIVKNEYLWTSAVIAQIVCAILIIYFLYMLYFDRIHEEHFGSIKQQIWSFMHFPLHISLVLVLQGVSLLIIWRQAVESLNELINSWTPALEWIAQGGEPDKSTLFADYISMNKTFGGVGGAIATYFNDTCYREVYNHIPKGVDASKEKLLIKAAFTDISVGFDNLAKNSTNATALSQFNAGLNSMTSTTFKTLFDTFSVTVSKKKQAKGAPDLEQTTRAYFNVFNLIMTYAFIAGGLALIINVILGFLALPPSERRVSQYVRLAFTAVMGISLCLISTIRFNEAATLHWLGSSWMIPTIALTAFFCVVVTHIRLPGKKNKAH